MKAIRPGTDQELEFAVFADDEILQEYALRRATAAQNILECFVPVTQGQKLTVKGRFKGTTLAASFDLVVDGSFLAESRLTDKGSRQYMNRKLTFERVYDCPRAKEGWTSKTHNPLDVYEANLYTEPLQDGSVDLTRLEQEDTTGERPGVGSIQVVANLQDSLFEHRMDPEWDMEGGGWVYRSNQPVRFAGIRPDHAIEVRHTRRTPIPQKRSKQHRNHWNVNTRPGYTPWARFIFYYRSQEKIDHAGSVTVGTIIHHSEPFIVPQETALRLSEHGPSARDNTPDEAASGQATSVRSPPLPNMLGFSRLGGDFRMQMISQSESLVSRCVSEVTSSHPAHQVPTGSFAPREWIEDAPSDRGVARAPLASQRPIREVKNAAVRSITTKSHLDDSATQLSTRDEFLHKLTSSNQLKARASPGVAHASSPAATMETSGPAPTNTSTTIPTIDMAKHTQFVSKLPSTADIVEMIAEEGITTSEAVKIFDDLASEHGFRKPPSLYNKVRAEYNARVDCVADLRGGNKYVLKDEYLARLEEHEEAVMTTPKLQNPPHAPTLAPGQIRAALTTISHDRASMRKRVSKSPGRAGQKKMKSEHDVAMEARRAELEKLKEQTAAILKAAEETRARRTAKKAEKARLREQKLREEQERLMRESDEKQMMEEEIEAQKDAQDAAKLALEMAESSDSAEDDDDNGDDDENGPQVEMRMGNGEGDVESEED